jgi:hypothetical protein
METDDFDYGDEYPNNEEEYNIQYPIKGPRNLNGTFLGISLYIQFYDGEIVTGVIPIPKDDLGNFDPNDVENTITDETREIITKYTTLWLTKQKILKFPHLQTVVMRDQGYINMIRNNKKMEWEYKAVEEIFKNKKDG